MSKSRRKFTSKFKAKVALEAISERLTMSELAAKYELHANQISTWKKELQANASDLFEKGRGPKKVVDEEKESRLFQQIGQLQYELSWLKKKYDDLQQ